MIQSILQENQPGSKFCFAAGDLKVECEDDLVSSHHNLLLFRIINSAKMFQKVSMLFLFQDFTPRPTGGPGGNGVTGDDGGDGGNGGE